MRASLKFRITLFAIGWLAPLFAQTSRATSILVPNGDFETIWEVGKAQADTGTIAGYTAGAQGTVPMASGTTTFSPDNDTSTFAGGGSVVIGNFASATVTSGMGIQSGNSVSGNSFYVNSAVFGGTGGTITTGPLGPTVNGANGSGYFVESNPGTYTLTVYVADHNGGQASGAVILNLLANGTAISGGVQSVNGVTESFTSNLPITTFEPYTVTYSAATMAGHFNQALTIQVGSTNGGGKQDDFDNITLDDTPEPASLAICTFAAAALLLRRRRQCPTL